MRQRVFSLLEMVTVLAVVMTLAALALPALHRQIASARFVEATVNADSLRTATLAWRDEFPDQFENWLWNPRKRPTREPVAFEPDLPDSSGWHLLGWEPDGLIRCAYAAGYAYSVSRGRFIEVQVHCDVDGDNTGLLVVSEDREAPSATDTVTVCTTDVAIWVELECASESGTSRWSSSRLPPQAF